MQAIFLGNQENIKAFRDSISEARFARYFQAANGNDVVAIEYYHWNSLLSQSLYLPLQTWEITLRNKLNRFLIWKYNAAWPYDQRALRAFTRNENRRLSETKDRLGGPRRASQIPTDSIVADLSAGFWVSLLTKSYDVTFAWRYNLTRIFPHDPRIDRRLASATCDQLLDLRNRVAHHEPIMHLDLVEMRDCLSVMIDGMCSATQAYTESACTFKKVWGAKPSASF